jgi:hypothetical protein
MRIFGLSQSTGVERLLEVTRADGGVSLHAHGRGDGPLEAIVVPEDELTATLIDRPAGGATVGAVPVGGWLLDVEVRGNEVLLRTRPEGERSWDVAVGLDDLQDALAEILPAG